MKLLFLLLIVFGVIICIWLLVQLVVGLRSLNWPSVVGELIMKDARDGAPITPAGSGGYVYRYNVRGIDYFSKRVTVSDAFISRARMVSRVLEKHPDGAMITVYYHKQRPKSSLLERGPRRETYIVLVLSILLVVGGIYGYRTSDTDSHSTPTHTQPRQSL